MAGRIFTGSIGQQVPSEKEVGQASFERSEVALDLVKVNVGQVSEGRLGRAGFRGLRTAPGSGAAGLVRRRSPLEERSIHRRNSRAAPGSGHFCMHLLFPV